MGYWRYRANGRGKRGTKETSLLYIVLFMAQGLTFEIIWEVEVLMLPYFNMWKNADYKFSVIQKKENGDFPCKIILIVFPN